MLSKGYFSKKLALAHEVFASRNSLTFNEKDKYNPLLLFPHVQNFTRFMIENY